VTDRPSASFADVDYDEAMRRARALVPVLRERAAAAEVGRDARGDDRRPPSHRPAPVPPAPALGRHGARVHRVVRHPGRLAGANGIYDRYPIQRLFRDQHALAAHIGFSWDAQAWPWGLVALGGEFSSPTM